VSVKRLSMRKVKEVLRLKWEREFPSARLQTRSRISGLTDESPSALALDLNPKKSLKPWIKSHRRKWGLMERQ